MGLRSEFFLTLNTIIFISPGYNFNCLWTAFLEISLDIFAYVLHRLNDLLELCHHSRHVYFVVITLKAIYNICFAYGAACKHVYFP